VSDEANVPKLMSFEMVIIRSSQYWNNFDHCEVRDRIEVRIILHDARSIMDFLKIG
jgi:hypothetical protein